MTGETVAQHVRVQMLTEFAHTGLAHPQLHGTGAEATPLLADEHRTVGGPGQRSQR